MMGAMAGSDRFEVRGGRWLALVLAVTVWVAMTCTDRSQEVEGGTRGRLEALGDRWFASQATIAYRTTEREPGDPTSPHQCLRQLVGGEVDGQTGLRICSGVGELRLAWDPPDRWRMDAASPDGTFVLLSTADGRIRCRGSDVVAKTCVAARRIGTFASVVDAPARILDETGLGGTVVTVRPARTIAGLPAECFRATGGSPQTPRRVEWCYSRDGLLLFFSDEVEGGRVTTLEATEVSRSVSVSDLDPPSSS